jgi:hypothetical protein
VQTYKTELSDVIYNAAEQSFEARVTVHGASGARSYACSIPAPIDLSFEDAAKGLATQALRKHGTPRGLHSWIAPPVVARMITRQTEKLRRGLPLGQYGFFRGRAA